MATLIVNGIELSSEQDPIAFEKARNALVGYPLSAHLYDALPRHKQQGYRRLPSIEEVEAKIRHVLERRCRNEGEARILEELLRESDPETMRRRAEERLRVLKEQQEKWGSDFPGVRL